MPPRVFFPRFMAMSQRPRVLFLVDSFAYVRAAWGRDCYVQQVLEHLFYAGTFAIAVVLGGACVVPGDYERMYELASQRFDMGYLARVVVVSMGNDLIASVRPMTLQAESPPLVVAGLLQLRSCLEPAEVSLVYGGSGVTWGYSPEITVHYDELVSIVLAGVSGFCYATSGAKELGGVQPVDAIGHLSVGDAYISGRLLLSGASAARSRL